MRFIWCFCLLCAPVAAWAVPAPTAGTSRLMPQSATLDAQLRAAIAANEASAAARLMKRGARPDDSTLELAVYSANLATWRALLNGGLSVNTRIAVSEEAGLGNNAPLLVVVAAGAAGDGMPDNKRRALLREFLARGADVNARAHNGQSALQVAEYNAGDDGQTAQILLDAGARVRPNDAWLLASAARLGNIALLERALKMGVRADSQAARGRHLLQRAVDIRRQSLNEDTPLYDAKDANARYQIAQTLLDAGAPVNDFDELGQTPIMLAADGSLRPALVELLLKAGADLNARQANGPTIWDYALPSRFYTKKQIETMLQGDPFALGDVAPDAATARALVATPEDTRTLELLLDAGIALEQTGARGQTPLMRAAQNNRAKTVAFLVARGANFNAADKNGNTALHVAAGTDSPDAVAALLDAGAQIEARNSKGLTPLLMASGAGFNGTTYYAPLSMTVEGYVGGPEALRALLMRGANVNATGSKSASALHYVAKNGDTKSAQLLVQRGAEVNARAARGVTALHIAAGAGDYSMSQLLLQLGADANLKADGLTPLDIARTPYVTIVNVGAHPSRETREMLAQFAKSDREITARRQQIARLMERHGLK